MKKRSIKLLAIIMSFVCAFCAINVTAYATDELKADTVSVSYSGKLDTPKVSISVASTKTPTLKLSWKEVDGANKYYIYRRDTKTGSLKLIAKTSKLYYKDTNVTKNKTYYYKVRAYKIENGKTIKKSDTSAIVKKAIVTLSKAKNVKATTVSDSKIKLSWDKTSGATRYYLYYSTSKNGAYKSIGYVTKTSYTFSKLNSSTTYYFKIRAAKVLDSKVYKASYSSVASAKTNSKDGEFIVDFKKISNKEAGLPTGSAMTCLTMLLNHYGANLDPMDVYEYFDCSTKFYKKEGRLYGPNHCHYFIGDPTSDKAYAYGAEMIYIGTIYKQILKSEKLNDIQTSKKDLLTLEDIKESLNENNIIFARVRFAPEYDVIFWRNDESATQMCINEKYVILCGYTDTHYIVYDPLSGQYEKYKILYDSNVFLMLFGLENK